MNSKPSLYFLTFALLTTILAPTSYAGPTSKIEKLAPCGPETKVGELCLGDLNELLPKQGALGYISVETKEKNLENKSKKDFSKYIYENPIPFVLGPHNTLHPVDHHHDGAAILKDGKRYAVFKMVKNWSRLTDAAFRAQMIANHFVYLFDENGKPITFDQLPLRLQDMPDDPYRSLSGAIRDAGGYTKKETDYFIEFIWANFYRDLKGDNAISREDIDHHFKKTVKKALKIAHSSLSRGLPGRTCTDKMH